ncbi:sex hormone-binding globulin isoform X1 [Siniperca chuatsi]|uniref:sex hormone-binding globulin isoform X1 n=1 Tax=Siniperca chuatsi TaxID=119488 RepID=UPI001CE215B4|nr:sex hormone-binding globulin isoform X1 [Siniperca chuatsi]
MAMFWKAMAGGLLFVLSLTLLSWGAVGQGNGRGKKEVSGRATVYLGQDRDIWRPLIHTTVNLTEISSIKSFFQLRTFDPEGVIFYGDTKNGVDWFVLSLKDGIALMQISKEDIIVSVAGGPKLNDGKWHTLQVSSQGKFVILEVDGSSGLVVGMQSKQPEEVLSGELRLALGGVLMDKEKLIVQFEPQMDGCVREGSWLNLSVPWETEAEELWPCYQNVQPGSYFPGTGFAIFNTSVFPIEADHGVMAELRGDFSKMDGTILSIKAPGQELMLALVANNNTKEVTLTFGKETHIMKDTLKRLVMTFKTNLLQVLQDEDESNTTTFSIRPLRDPGYLTTWREGRLAIGGLLGEGEDNVGSQFLTGCLEKIQVQGRDLDLDLAVKHMSISSHSCPA